MNTLKIFIKRNYIILQNIKSPAIYHIKGNFI